MLTYWFLLISNDFKIYKYILDINDRTSEILDQTHIITAEICKIQTPSYTENIIQLYKKFENINVGEKKEVEQKNDDGIMKTLEEIKKLILNNTSSNQTNSSDSQMDFMKMLSSGILNRK